MAWTQADLDAAKAIYAGLLESVRHGDKSVTYAATEKQLAVIREIERSLSPTTVVRSTLCEFDRGL